MRDLKGRTLVVASHNAGKLREFADLLGPFGIDAKSAKEFGLPLKVEALLGIDGGGQSRYRKPDYSKFKRD